MNQYVVHNMVEYIKTQAEFPFDAIDVEESLEEVLGFFGLHPQLDTDERELLRKDLLQMALSEELAEMQRMVDMGLSSGLGRVMDMLHNGGRFPHRRPSVSSSQFMEQMRLV